MDAHEQRLAFLPVAAKATNQKRVERWKCTTAGTTIFSPLLLFDRPLPGIVPAVNDIAHKEF